MTKQPRKWGFDLDDCLVEFTGAFLVVLYEQTGRQLDPRYARDWRNSIDQPGGYTFTEVETGLKYLYANPGRWLDMAGTPDLDILNAHLPAFMDTDDIYFVTARQTGKVESELWLYENTSIHNPTVIRTESKGRVAEALGLDIFVDDRLDVALDIRVESPATRIYLLDRPYNAYDPIDGIYRISTLQTMFDIELS